MQISESSGDMLSASARFLSSGSFDRTLHCCFLHAAPSSSQRTVVYQAGLGISVVRDVCSCGNTMTGSNEYEMTGCAPGGLDNIYGTIGTHPENHPPGTVGPIINWPAFPNHHPSSSSKTPLDTQSPEGPSPNNIISWRPINMAYSHLQGPCHVLFNEKHNLLMGQFSNHRPIMVGTLSCLCLPLP